MTISFIKGLALSEQFHREAVKPILDARFPGLVYSAARIGAGSDVLGYDTPRSMDHGWGAILELYLSEEDHPRVSADIAEVLRHELPREVAGIPTSFDAPTVGLATF